MSGTWMSIMEYARHYNVSDMTIRRRIKTGKLRAELRDGKYYIPAHDTTYSQTLPREEELQIDLSPTITSELAQTKYDPAPMTKGLTHTPNQGRDPHLLSKFEQLTETIDQALDHVKQREELLRDNFESQRVLLKERISHLEQDLQTKDKEISHLKKDIEDLEILVKLLESKVS